MLKRVLLVICWTLALVGIHAQSSEESGERPEVVTKSPEAADGDEWNKRDQVAQIMRTFNGKMFSKLAQLDDGNVVYAPYRFKNSSFFSFCHHPGGSFFIERVSHLSNVKQMYSQPIHLTHEILLCLHITRGGVHFNADSAVKSPCWQGVSKLGPSDPYHAHFAAIRI